MSFLLALQASAGEEVVEAEEVVQQQLVGMAQEDLHLQR